MIITTDIFKDYQAHLINCMQSFDWSPVLEIAREIRLAQGEGKHIFLCGNGGSAANAIHIANDFLFLQTEANEKGINVTALSANQAVMTCLANDIGYENIFSHQLRNLGKKGDILIVFSGSGNSLNILKAIEAAKEMGIQTCALLGFDGGKCLNLVDIAVHFPIDNMQIAEDLQLIAGHMIVQGLSKGMLNE